MRWWEAKGRAGCPAVTDSWGRMVNPRNLVSLRCLANRFNLISLRCLTNRRNLVDLRRLAKFPNPASLVRLTNPPNPVSPPNFLRLFRPTGRTAVCL